MTIEKLAEIIGSANRKAIRRRLLGLGYTDCAKDKTLGEVSLIDLFAGDEQHTGDVFDKDRKFVFCGRIVNNVKGSESFEFITVSVFRIIPSVDPFEEESAIQIALDIYAADVCR